MTTEISRIAFFIINSMMHVWPWLLISVPAAVAVKMSGASNYIERAFTHRPIVSVFLATVVGAFSPFCSCSVIPVITSLLIGGVPLAPVMSFWLASPSMDPEIFFMSVSIIGWKLAVWRLASAFFMSLIAGLITHYLVKKEWISNDYVLRLPEAKPETGSACGCSGSQDKKADKSFRQRLVSEIFSSTIMVVKFMTLAYFLEALIVLYIPAQFTGLLLGKNQYMSIILAALAGVPVYTSSMPALALAGGLISRGMAPAAGLAFLISGPTTTIPAMAAVWKIADRKVFLLYTGFTLAGAVISGLMFQLLN